MAAPDAPPLTKQSRWARTFALRRAMIPHILLAGSRPPRGNERGPQHFVCLSDGLDDVLYAALKREALLATRGSAR
jgi:hypothetical protein